MLSTDWALGRDRLGRHGFDWSRDVFPTAFALDYDPLCAFWSRKHEASIGKQKAKICTGRKPDQRRVLFAGEPQFESSAERCTLHNSGQADPIINSMAHRVQDLEFDGHRLFCPAHPHWEINFTGSHPYTAICFAPISGDGPGHACPKSAEWPGREEMERELATLRPPDSN
jgi:hypothetical protein